MPEQLTQKLLEWANSLQNLAVEELPMFAKEIVAYKTWSAFIGFYIASTITVISLVFCLIGLVAFFYFSTPFNIKHYSEVTDFFAGVFIVCGLVFMVSLLFTGITYCEVKKCETAPRLVLLEAVRRM